MANTKVITVDMLKVFKDKFMELLNTTFITPAETDTKINTVKTEIDGEITTIESNISTINTDITNIKSGSALPIASDTNKGAVKVDGNSISIDAFGVIATKIPVCPTDTDGTYKLEAIVSNGVVEYSWVIVE